METKVWSEKIQQSVGTTVTNMDNGNNLLDSTNIPSDNTNNNEDTCNRNLRLQQEVQSIISDKGRQKIHSILDQVTKLKPIEKLLLYLKLPTESNDNIDPLRQSLNPLGSRSEINLTIMWIKTHLVEDPELSLQKKSVYDDYHTYCDRNKIKALSTADFGKVMKQVYPNVRPRRLGTRGNSKYCYSGLKSRIKLSSPFLPDLAEKPLSSEIPCSQSDLVTAAWIIIKEWADEHFRGKFKSFTSLAYHLITELSIGNGSEAANLVLNANRDETVSSFGYLSRHKETTLQLQRKLQQKTEGTKEMKRKQLQSPKMEQKSRIKKMKVLSASTSCSTSPVAASDSKSSPQSQEHSPVCDSINLQALPDFNCFQRPPNSSDALNIRDKGSHQLIGEPIVGKVPIPRITNQKQSPPVLSPKRAKNNTQYKAIQPKPECDRASYNPKQTLIASRQIRSQQEPSKRQRAKKGESPIIISTEESNSLFTRERLDSVSQVSKDALDDYLEMSNSQEPEEEMMKYFNNDDHDKKQISQLRQLLANNEKINISSSSNAKTNLKAAQKSLNPNLNVKRRVSFDTHVQEETVPESLNTRRQNILSHNFIPISPQSPNGRQSMSSSTNVSPFVSPRNTPVPRIRGISHPYVNPTTNLKQFKQKQPKKVDLEHISIENIGTSGLIGEFKHQFTNLPMSAPPSPKTNYMFKTYQNFTPQIQNDNFPDTLSTELTQLLNNKTLSSEDNAFRSQSVPANAGQNQFFNQYSFSNDQTQTLTNTFNELTELGNDNVSKIIDQIGTTNLEMLDINLHPNDFDSNQNVSINENLNIPLFQNSCQNRIIRSQSIEVENSVNNYNIHKFPSRSVPSTPVPYHPNIELEPFNKNFNSKSYPSTPLTQETFTFNPGQDYLLNGQPIKDKLGDFMQGNDNKAIYEYHDNDLIDNKDNFNFDGAMADSNFGAKQNINSVLNDEGVDDFFKGE